MSRLVDWKLLKRIIFQFLLEICLQMVSLLTNIVLKAGIIEMLPSKATKCILYLDCEQTIEIHTCC